MRALTPLLALLFGLVLGPASSPADDESVDVRVRFSQRALLESNAIEVARSLAADQSVVVRLVLDPALHDALVARVARDVARSGSVPPAAMLEELGRWARISVRASELPRVLDAVATDWRIDRYEEVLLARVQGLVPDDPLLPNQAGWLDQVHLPAAWAAVSREGGRGARVAVVDGGTEWDHPDLVANVAVNEADPAGDGIDPDQNGFVDDAIEWCFARGDGDPSPLDGQNFNARHGTHVAGIVGAVLGNGTGIAGAGGNPELILVNAAHPTIDGGIAYGYEGILYAVARGADVINCSWRTARFV